MIPFGMHSLRCTAANMLFCLDLAVLADSSYSVQHFFHAVLHRHRGVMFAREWKCLALSSVEVVGSEDVLPLTSWLELEEMLTKHAKVQNATKGKQHLVCTRQIS